MVRMVTATRHPTAVSVVQHRCPCGGPPVSMVQLAAGGDSAVDLVRPETELLPIPEDTIQVGRVSLPPMSPQVRLASVEVERKGWHSAPSRYFHEG
ncbi:hypothetical protein MRX96_014059 [Rhipicephalus microplus]